MFSFCVFVLFLHFWFSLFLVSLPQSNHRKSFYCHGKYFVKENFFCTCFNFSKILWWEQNRQCCSILRAGVANQTKRTEFTASCSLVELSCHIISCNTVSSATEGTISSVTKIGRVKIHTSTPQGTLHYLVNPLFLLNQSTVIRHFMKTQC